MSPYGVMLKPPSQDDAIWKALADATRRDILDELALQPKTTGELVQQFRDLSRTNVMKHMEVLVQANLIVVRREGRKRWNYLNPAPIQSVCDRWVSKHVKRLSVSMSRLKKLAELNESSQVKSNPKGNNK